MPFTKKKEEDLLRIKVICVGCGKAFKTWPYLKNRQKFCSNKCKHKYYRIRRNLSISVLPKKRAIITCHNKLCRKKFITWPYKKDKRKFCSAECYFKFHSIEYEKNVIINIERKEVEKKREIWKLNLPSE